MMDEESININKLECKLLLSTLDIISVFFGININKLECKYLLSTPCPKGL